MTPKRRKTTSYGTASQVSPERSGRLRREAKESRRSLDLSPLSDGERRAFETAWTLATEYHIRGRDEEAVEYYLVSAALLERNGVTATPVYEAVLSIDPGNRVARARLEARGRPDLFAEHILSRHDLAGLSALLRAEQARNWATTPRGRQKTCPDCGMGVPEGATTCPMCGASLAPTYAKRATAGYSVDAVRRSADLPAVDVGQRSSSRERTPRQSAPAEQPRAARVSASVPAVGDQGKVRILSGDGASMALLAVGSQPVPLDRAPGLADEPRRQLRDIRVCRVEGRYRVEFTGVVFRVLREESAQGRHLRLQVGHQLLEVAPHSGSLRLALLDGQWRPVVRIAFPTEHLTVGRSGNALDLPSDPYVAERHVEIALSGAEVVVRDLGTEAGTFLALESPAVLPAGVVLRVGSYYFRLEP